MQIQVINLAGSVNQKTAQHGSLRFIGTATTLIEAGGFTILTDPNFLHAGDHAHLGYGLKSTRLSNPAIDIDQLPPLDLCVLSHMHGDHWDEVARDRLSKELPIVSTTDAVRQLRAQGFNRAIILRYWDNVEARRANRQLRITAMPGRHGPMVINGMLPQVMGSMLEWVNQDGGIGYRMYISGDTLLCSDLEEIPRRFPNIDLGLFHLGGTRLFKVLLTMDAEQGVKAIKLIHPDIAIPIHYNDYPVFKSPLEDFMSAVTRAGLERSVRYLRHGDIYEFAIRSAITSRASDATV